MNLLIIFAAKYLILVSILIAVLTAFLGNKATRTSLAKLSLLTFPMAFIIAKLLSFFIDDPRPFVVDHIQPLIAHSADNGFPSDHTLLAATIASVLFVYNRKLGLFLFLLSLIIGVARVLAQVHHPVDIVGSILIAIICTYISVKLLSKYGKNHESN